MALKRNCLKRSIFAGNGNDERGFKGGLPFIFRQAVVNTKGAAGGLSVVGVSYAYTARQVSYFYDEHGAVV